MALDRDQVGLLFKVDVNSMDAQQQLALFQGVVEGMAAETGAALSRVGARLQTTTQQLNATFGDSARGQLAGFVGQFGLVGDAAAGMIPGLSGSAAAMAGVAGAAVAAGAALGATAMATANYAGALNDLADVSNLEIDTLQGLNAGAALVGQSFESLTSTTVVFQRQIEAAKTGNEEMAATFRALGIDLNGSVDDAFRQSIERLASLEDGSQKTALATELFGKQGIQLLKIMKEMDGSYANLIQKADEFGVKLSKEDVAAADEFGKRLDILSIKVKGLTYNIGTGLIKALDSLGDAFVEAFDPEAAAKVEQAAIARLEGVDTAAGQVADYGKAIDEARRQVKEKAAKTTASRAETEKFINLPSGDAIKRAYDSYVNTILTEERRLAVERERLRVEALGGEEARLIDAARSLEERLTQARLEAGATGNDLLLGRVTAQRVANLEAEAKATNRKLLDLQAQRVALEEADQMAREANVRASEERNRAEVKKTYDEQVKLSQAIRAMIEEGKRQRQAELAADPSSPLSIFGAQGQEAADRGAGVFAQIGASASEAISGVSQQLGNFSSMMTDAFSSIAGGLQNIIAGFIMTGRVGGQAFKALAAQVIAAVTAQAAVKAIFELAEGFAASAVGNVASATQHFTAAKFYGTVAGVAAAASVGLAAIGGGGGGADNGTMFLGQDRATGSATMEQGARRGRSEPQVIVIRAETEPGVMVSKFVQDYRSNGEARSVLRRDLLGEF